MKKYLFIIFLSFLISSSASAFKKLSFSTSQIGAMAALVDVDKMTHEDAAKKWLADNESVWKAFTK